MKNLSTVGLAVLLIVGGVYAGGGVHKGPPAPDAPAFTGDEIIHPKQSRVYPPTPLAAPGDSIMFTTYDYGTNGSVNRNIVNYGNGILAFARMMAQGSGTTPTDRGSWYNFTTNGGRTWQHSWGRVETAYRGWSNMDQIRDFGGLEVIVSHIGSAMPLEINVDADRGANAWLSNQTPAGSKCLWPRMAIGAGTTLHIVHADSNPPTRLGYSRSTDAGLNWDRVGVNIFPPNAGIQADAYAATARGNTVAFVIVGQGNDVVLLRSTNNGDSWTSATIYQVTNPPPTPQPQPDRSCDVLIDGSGVIHVVWSNYLNINGTLFLSIDAPIMYWNSASGVVRNIALPVQDTTIATYTNRFGNFATQPDLGADASGNNIYCVYTALIPERDAANLNYSHIFALRSTNGGTTWGPAVDITPGSGFDAVFHTIPDLVEDTLHVAYFADRLAGGFIRGNHSQTQVALMWLRVPVSSLPGPTGVQELEGVPSEYALGQNYPNPFNPSTNIRFELPRSGFVSLSVFNLLGQEVASLVNEMKQAGRYETAWDAAGLPSGVYLYRLTAGNHVATKKMILLK